jgi:uncharacterized membrane protein
MNELIKGSIVFAIVLLIVDQIWILGGKNIHFSVIEKVQKSSAKINIYPAIGFYLLSFLIWYYFLSKKDITWKEAFIFGIILYGTFDLTNIAIFKDYPVWYGLVDTIWGGLAIMTATIITQKIIKLF